MRNTLRDLFQGGRGRLEDTFHMALLGELTDSKDVIVEAERIQRSENIGRKRVRNRRNRICGPAERMAAGIQRGSQK